MNRSLLKITRGELLWLNRKNRRMTQVEAANLIGVSKASYQRSERDQSLCTYKCPPDYRAQLLALARRRSGVGLDGLARRLKVSKVTIHKWERLGSERLKKYWEGRGFTFT